MLLPQTPVIKALAARHDYDLKTGYQSDAYLSTAAIVSLLSAISTVLGAGALYLSGKVANIDGSVSVFDTTLGSSDATGA